MAKTLVEVLTDDLDGSVAVESVRIGWNGQWRQVELSEKNLVALHKAIDRYWQAARPVREAARPPRHGKRAYRDTGAIRAWAAENGIEVGDRGRIPADVERQYNEAQR